MNGRVFESFTLRAFRCGLLMLALSALLLCAAISLADSQPQPAAKAAPATAVAAASANSDASSGTAPATPSTPSAAPASAANAAAKPPSPSATPGAAEPVVAAAQNAASTEASAKNGVGNNIKVHGHWVITVTNPDGTVAQRREFENMLQSGVPLTYLLAGDLLGGWSIQFYDPNNGNGSPCVGGDCLIYQSGVTYSAGANATPTSFVCAPASDESCNLSLSTGNDPNGRSALVLSGQLQASQTGNIGGVSTAIWLCGPGTGSLGVPTSTTPLAVTPAQCAADNLPSGVVQLPQGALTATNLTSPIMDVQPMQTVNVVVYISFM